MIWDSQEGGDRGTLCRLPPLLHALS